MRIIAIIAAIGILPVSGCKNSNDKANHPEEVPPLYEDRVFVQDGIFGQSKINISMIEQLKPWDKGLLMSLFEPIAGTSTVYTYKSTYRIPENIDGTEGVYDEYLIVEAADGGRIQEALLYEGGPKQGPLFHSLYRDSEPDFHMIDLKNTSQFDFICPYESFDRTYNGDARVVSADGEELKEGGEQGAVE